MSIDKVIVIISGILGIFFTYWFFLGKKDTETQVIDSVDIVVDGGYSPQNISISKGKTTLLKFFRKDSNPCLEEVILSDFKIKKYLPLNQKVEVKIIPQKEGIYNFSCGMNMFHGRIIVK